MILIHCLLTHTRQSTTLEELDKLRPTGTKKHLHFFLHEVFFPTDGIVVEASSFLQKRCTMRSSKECWGSVFCIRQSTRNWQQSKHRTLFHTSNIVLNLILGRTTVDSSTALQDHKSHHLQERNHYNLNFILRYHSFGQFDFHEFWSNVLLVSEHFAQKHHLQVRNPDKVEVQHNKMVTETWSKFCEMAKARTKWRVPTRDNVIDIVQSETVFGFSWSQCSKRRRTQNIFTLLPH